jgi:hypothetical protein
LERQRGEIDGRGGGRGTRDTTEGVSHVKKGRERDSENETEGNSQRERHFRETKKKIRRERDRDRGKEWRIKRKKGEIEDQR